MGLGLEPGGQHGAGVGEHRVVAVFQGRWCRRGRPYRGSRSASGRAARWRRPPPPGPRRARPCSTWSSTKTPTWARVSSSRPRPSGSRPPAREHLVEATALGRRRGRGPAPGRATPVSSREPMHGTPNRAPSSSVKQATAIGRSGRNPSPRSRSIAWNADATPSGPSNAPPSRTESRWLPVTSPGPSADGSPHHAHRLPLRSSWLVSPRVTAWWVNHSRNSRSADDQASRR